MTTFRPCFTRLACPPGANGSCLRRPRLSAGLRWGAVWLVAVVTAGAVLAQELETIPQQVPVPPTIEEIEELPGRVIPEEETVAAGAVERTIYVPFENLEEVFEQRGRGVFLPYDEYENLWQAFLRDRAVQAEAPEGGTVRLAEYSGELVAGGLKVEARLEVEALREGWSRVNLGADLPTVVDADLGDTRLHRSEEGLELLLPQRGLHEVRLSFLLPVRVQGEQSIADLRLPNAAIGRFEMTLPGAGLEVELGTGLPFTTANVEGEDATSVSFFFGGTRQVPLSWRERDETEELEALYFVDSNLRTEIRPGVMTSQAVLEVRILRGGLERLEIELAPGQLVLDVVVERLGSGADENSGLTDWEVEPAAEEGGPTVLVLRSTQPLEGQWRVKIDLESALAALPAEVDVPLPVVRGALRQRGQVLVLSEPELEVTSDAGEGLTRRAEGETPEGLESVGRFRFLEMPVRLQATVREAQPLIDLNSVLALEVLPHRANLKAELNYEVRRVGVFNVRLGLPSGWQGVEATGEGVSDFAVTGEGEERVLEIRFSAPRMGAGQFHVTAWRSRDEPTDALDLPVLRSEGTRLHQGRLQVTVDGALSPTTGELGDLRVAERDAAAQTVQTEGSALVFSYRDPQTGGVMNFTRRPSQVTSDLLTRVTVEEQRVVYLWQLTLDVRYAGIDTFQLAVPEGIAERFQLVHPQVREVRPLDPPEDGDEGEDGDESLAGMKIFEVVLRERLLGRALFEPTLELPLTGFEAGKSEHLKVPFLRTPGVFQEIGQVALGKSGNIEILGADPTGLEETDPRRLRSGGSEGVFIAWQYRNPPAALKLEVSRNSFVAVPGAVIPHADLSVAVSTDGAMTCEVVLWLQNRTQQFLTLRLPEGARLVSDVFVAGERQQPMRRADDEAVLVRLEGVAMAGTEPVAVRLLYELPSAEPGSSMPGGGRWLVPVPTVDEVRVLQSRLRLYLPQEAVFTRFDGPMRLPVRQSGWARFRRIADIFIPALGPDIEGRAPSPWSGPPPLEEQPGSGLDLDLPREGQLYELHRLAEPAEVTVKFRSRGRHQIYEALVFLLALTGTVMVGRTRRLLYSVVVGIGFLLLAGLIQGQNGSIALAGFAGVAVVVPVWMAAGFLRALGRRFRRSDEPPPPERPRTNRPGSTRPDGPHGDEQPPAKPSKRRPRS